ncbi:MAG: hypothetical protein FJ288_01060 [Planctomycetes bacterium]|nr:hypothetical protein [Planctomycetota bacterium]
MVFQRNTGRGFAAAAVGILAAVAALPGEPLAAQERVNLAAGRKVSFSPAPNYALTAKGGTDETDLTDGRLAAPKTDRLWFDSAAVGYSYAGLNQLAVDLGEARNIGEVAVRFQGGSPQAGICFPCRVDLVASADGVQYYRVASCSRWNEDDFDNYRVPRDEGKAWVHTLRFRDVNVRARAVGLEIYGTALSVTDELWVYEGSGNATYRPATEGAASDFTVSAPRMHFHKPVVHVPINTSAPTPVGLLTPPGLGKMRAAAVIDLPRGVRFEGGHLDGVAASAARAEVLDGGAFTRYTFDVDVAAGKKNWGRLYLRADWHDQQRGVLWYRLRPLGPKGGAEAEPPLIEQPILAIQVPPAPRPQRLMTGLGWCSFDEVLAWPGAIEAFRVLGFTTVPMFARYTHLDDPAVRDALERFRAAGFKVINIDSTFHHALAKAGKRRGELACQFADGGQGQELCPSYRGPLYQAEIDRVARECAAARADYLSCDVELWGWRGPADAPWCTRCQADFKKSGAKDWAAWQLDKGEEIWRDVAARVRAAVKEAGAPEPELGVYDFRPGQNYQNFWPFDRLYPRYMTNSQVSTYTPLYPYHLAMVGDEARADRARLPRSDVLPWLTPGNAGTFPGEAFTWALVECFANGSRGVHFWNSALWDAESLAAHARAVRIAAPVEDVIVNGAPAEGVRTEPPVRTCGMRRGDDMFLLIADYYLRGKKTVEVELPMQKACTVTDLDAGGQVARLAAGERRFRVVLHGGRPAALRVKD